MTYCCRRVSSTGSKPLIPRASSPPDWRIGNSFAYKCVGSVACKATRRTPSSLFDPTLTHVEPTRLSVRPSAAPARFLQRSKAATSDNKLTGVPSWPVGAVTPPGVVTRGIARGEIFVPKKRASDSELRS
jgi:hypothetical protein